MEKPDGDFPSWVKEGPWLPFVQELAKHVKPKSKTWDEKLVVNFENFDLTPYSREVREIVSHMGWLFVRALHREITMCERAVGEVNSLKEQLQALKDQITVTSECVRTSTRYAKELEEKLKVTKSVNAYKRQKVRKPVKKVRTIDSYYSDNDSTYSNSEDEIVVDLTDEEERPKKHARPLITKHRKRQHDREDMADGNVYYRNPKDIEVEELREYTQTELSDLSKQYRQRPGEPLMSWVLRLWDEGADSVVLSGKEAVAMGVLTHDPQLRQAMRKAREFTVNFSLLDLVRDGIVRVYANPVELENTNPWRSMREGVSRLREMGCITGLGQMQDWMGPDMEPFTAGLRSKLMKSAPYNLRAPLLSLLGGLGLQGKIHEATTLLSELGDLEDGGKVKPIRTVDELKPKRTDKRKQSAEKGAEKAVKSGEYENKGKTRIVITRKQMWVDLLKGGVPREEIDGISTAELLKRWKKVVGRSDPRANETDSSRSGSEEEEISPVRPKPTKRPKENTSLYPRVEIEQHERRNWEVPTPL